MSAGDASAGALEFHQEVPTERRASAALHEENAAAIREIRDRLNDHLGTQLLSVNDVVLIALVMAGRYDAFAAGDVDEPTDADEERYRPLTAVIRDVMADSDAVPKRSNGRNGDGGED